MLRRKRIAVATVVTVLGAGGVTMLEAGGTAGAAPSANGVASQNVIVVLRDEATSDPATPSHLGERRKLFASAQAPLASQVASSGGAVTSKLSTLDAFAATVSPAEKATLASNPSVAEVVPDALVQAPPSATPTPAAASGGGPVVNGIPSGVCPTDPRHPILEPEALGIIHAASSDPSTLTAQTLDDGTGVKVAYAAEGIDIHNPDFTRPDGTSVFSDYQDFTGDGPNADTSGGEAFGDASSIAAQGNTPHDISQYVNTAHPLPAGCNIEIRGVAPGASLVGLKVFPNTGFAFTSVILQALDYAVTTDHVNVINESFGSNPIPDTTQDAIKQFNDQATAAGVTVVVSSGDAGTQSTIGSAATDPNVLDVGATTQFRYFFQTGYGGEQFATNGWNDENIAEFSSGGFDQAGATVDLVAPGNESWEACTPSPVYADCLNDNGQPSPVAKFGGTSESAPLTAGTAALVIEAYRQTHGGASPTPALVKQIITSTASDLQIPSYEQGAGELNALAAVEAARSVGTADGSPTPVGNNLLVSPGQLDVSGPAGSTQSESVSVQNVGAIAQTVSAHARQLGQQLSDDAFNVTLHPTTDPTFLDEFGQPMAFQTHTLHVPAGADRIDASVAWVDPDTYVNLTLIDPNGKMTAFTYQNGGGANFAHVDVRAPTPGAWKVIIWTPAAGGLTGTQHIDLSTSRFVTVGNVTPTALTLAPGQTGTLHVKTPVPSSPGDSSQDLELDSSTGNRTAVPIVVRSLVTLNRNGGDFSGTLTGGDGRDAVYEQLDTYAFNVPHGTPELTATLTFSHDPGTQLDAFLVSPDGQVISQNESHPEGGGQVGMQNHVRAPAAGQWKYEVEIVPPDGGHVTAAPYTGHIDLRAPQVTSSGVPDSRTTVLPAGRTTTATVTVTNVGPSPLALFADPRLAGAADLPLLELAGSDPVALPVPGTGSPPVYLVPTETSSVAINEEATEPVTFDFGPFAGDPDLESTSSGNNAQASFAANEVTPGLWFVAPAPIGPFAGPAPAGQVSTQMTADTQPFNTDITSRTGDIWQEGVDPTATDSPITDNPGQTKSFNVRFTPTGARGSVVSGTIYIDDEVADLGSGDELFAIPYRYRIG